MRKCRQSQWGEQIFFSTFINTPICWIWAVVVFFLLSVDTLREATDETVVGHTGMECLKWSNGQ